MLDTEILKQLRGVFERLERPVRLHYYRSSHAKQTELLELFDDLQATSQRIEVEELDKTSDFPRFYLSYEGKENGIRFTGVPGGHEFTSLVMALLHSDAKGKRPDAGLIERIRRLKGPVRLRTFVSLSCTNCPDVVQALNLMATVHADFVHETVDGEFVPDEIQALGIQGVPSVMNDEKLVSSGKTTLADLLSRLEDEFGSDKAEEHGPIDLGEYDVTVVGGGPAGAASAIYSARKGLRTVMIADRLGGQLQDTKGIENLISVPYTEGPKLSAKLILLCHKLGAGDVQDGGQPQIFFKQKVGSNRSLTA